MPTFIASFRFARLALLAATLLSAPLAQAAKNAATPPSYDGTFWAHWGDGRAELSGYRLVQPRYGEAREGTAVAIFVTETFSESLRVKADPGRHPASDEFPVLKLNLVEDFQTGIYDYNLMMSAFVALEGRGQRPPGTPTKLSFSGQEWCGHVWHQLLFDDRRIRETLHSYFDGEADRNGLLEYPEEGLSEDVLLLWARELAGPVLAPGQSVEVPFLPSLKRARLDHKPLAWTRATLTREAHPREVEVPAGRFAVDVFRVSTPDGVQRTYFVERAPPRRVVKWEQSDGYAGELLGSERLRYWEMNGRGFERALLRIGLRPPRVGAE